MIAVEVEPYVAIKVGNARDAEAAAQVLEVLVVGNFPEVDSVSPTRIEDRAMLVAELVARFVQDAVVRKIVGGQDTVISAGQVTKLSFKLQAAVRQQARRNRRIVVRGDIPVVRHPDFVTTAARAADFRGQQPGFSRIADGEGQVGRIQDGHAFESQLDVPRGAHAFARIEFDRFALQQPVL